MLQISDSNIWSRDIVVPANKEIPYRYLVCSVDPATENIHVRRWETHLELRKISVDQSSTSPASSSPKASSVPDIDTFGDISGIEKMDRGWLTTETVFQFKFIRNPFILKQKLKNRLLYVKVRIRSFFLKTDYIGSPKKIDQRLQSFFLPFVIQILSGTPTC